MKKIRLWYLMRKFGSKYSIIQLITISISALLFLLFFIFYIYITQLYWLNENSKTETRLMTAALMCQSQIENSMAQINNYKNQQDLNVNEKINGVNLVLEPIITKVQQANPDVLIGYYDLDFESNIFSNSNLNTELFTSWLHANVPKHFPERSFITDNHTNPKKVLATAVPLLLQDKITGFIWVENNRNDIPFLSYLIFSRFLIYSLLIWILVVLVVKFNFNNITKSLGAFSTMIIDNDPNISKMLDKLPELKPVFNRIKLYMEDLKKINSELAVTSNKLTTIMQGITDGFFALDKNWQVTFANNETIKITKNAELLGKNIWSCFPNAIGTDDYKKMLNSMELDEPAHWESTDLFLPDRFYEIHTYPFQTGLTIFFRDITDQKLHQEELHRLEKLNLIGQLAAGISHEVRNPLTTVRGFLQLFASKDTTIKNKEYFDLMIGEIDRANSIITDFLSLTKKSSDSMRLNNLNTIIEKLFPLLEADAFTSKKELRIELHPLPDTMLNESEIKQLILNLVRNGLEASPEGGKVTISTNTQNDRILLAIQDEGTGISKEIQEKIGTPFFTTKGNGTGLGLATSISIARRHNGELDFVTNGNGTTFRLSLAISQPA